MFIQANPNPNNNYTGDCVIRAISIAENKEWDDIYLDLMAKGFKEKDMIETNSLWSAYLRGLGYSRHIIPDTCPDCYTVKEFAKDNPSGTFILGSGTHAVVVRDGSYYDTWDSGNITPIYYFVKE